MKVESFPRRKLKPNPANPRNIGADAVAAVADSIKRFGWRQPIVARRSTKEIEAGHTRWLAAELLEIEDVPVVFFSDDAATASAFNIADNRTGELSDWDERKLGDLLRQLEQEDALEAVGFSAEDVRTFVGGLERAEGRDKDRETRELETSSTPALDDPGEPIARRGDVFEIAGQVLACGDARDPDLVRELMGSKAVPLVITDPPYCSGGFQESAKVAGSWGDIASDNLTSRGYVSLMGQVLAALRPQAAYFFTDWKMWPTLAYEVLEPGGLAVRSMIVWDKRAPALGSIWRTQHELVAFGSRRNPKRPAGVAGLGNVFACPRTGNKNHVTEKPVELLAYLIRGDEVAGRGKDVRILDPFAGSGTTLLAALSQKREAVGIELEPRWVDAALRRLEAATGQAATLRGSGETLEDLAAERS